MPDGWPESIEEQSQSLVDKIANICEKAPQNRMPPLGDRRDRGGAFLPGNTEVDEAVVKAVKHVCSREPLGVCAISSGASSRDLGSC